MIKLNWISRVIIISFLDEHNDSNLSINLKHFNGMKLHLKMWSIATCIKLTDFVFDRIRGVTFGEITLAAYLPPKICRAKISNLMLPEEQLPQSTWDYGKLSMQELLDTVITMQWHWTSPRTKKWWLNAGSMRYENLPYFIPRLCCTS